jgi:hypothetical protein
MKWMSEQRELVHQASFLRNTILKMLSHPLVSKQLPEPLIILNCGSLIRRSIEIELLSGWEAFRRELKPAFQTSIAGKDELLFDKSRRSFARGYVIDSTALLDPPKLISRDQRYNLALGIIH